MPRFWAVTAGLAALASGVLAWAAAAGGLHEFRSAWAVWASGRSASGESLWGTTVLWWARTGKFLQFAAAWTAILDIVGPDRLQTICDNAGDRRDSASKRAVAERSRYQAQGEVAARLFTTISLPVVADIAAFFSADGIASLGAQLWVTVGGIVAVFGVLALAFLAVRLIELWHGFLGIVLVEIPFYVVVALTVKPIEIFVRGAKPGHKLRYLALVLFFVGFSFDLLGS